MKNLFIVIVDFNKGEDLGKLVENLKREKVSGWEINFKIINNNKNNFGFAKGVNIGIRYALQNNADKVLLLNPDVMIEKGFIQIFINNPADIVSPVIKFKRDNNWVYDFGGKVDWRWGRTSHFESTNQLINQSTNYPIDYLSGCCMLIKRKVFEKIGLLDEKFFLYFEDADFCLRAKQAGFKIRVEPKSVITHQLVEGNQRSSFKKYHLLRSNFIFINKYLGIRRILGYLYLLGLTVKMVMDNFLHHPRSPSATSEVF